MDAQHYRELLEENLKLHRPQLLRRLRSEGNLEPYLAETSEQAADQFALLHQQYLESHAEPSDFFERVARLDQARRWADEHVRLNLIQLPDSDTERAIRQGGYRDQTAGPRSPMDTSLLPRAWDGDIIVRVAKTPDGGLESQVWRDGAWRPASLSLGKVGSLPIATASELEAAGVSG